MKKLTPVPYATRVEPSARVFSKDFVATRGADVQATWRRLCGWTPLNRQPVAELQQRPCNTSQL